MPRYLAYPTGPSVQDAALEYLEKRQAPQQGGDPAANPGTSQAAGNGAVGNNNGTAGTNGTANGNATVSGGAGGNGTNSSATVSIPATAAAGAITMLEPAQTGSVSYYKIAPSETITFKWNMTDLYVQPSNLTVVASCSANGNTYPVGPTDGAQNVFDGNTTEVHWVPYDWEQVPGQPRFAAASYVLQIWDERGPGVARKGGWLSPYSGTKFGMYIPQPYTPLADWTCATCSSAQRLLGQPAGLSIMTSLIVMFVSAYAVLRRA
ncbi:hypothetical protein CcaverHIS002_0410640 [Cutaneotrichosporon cavernicola]|uniref:DUF7137 domain-containing protein n=1 Tax=Cutaneotrichosporon cavernicola TaxID=279322 RepID=A0AA48QWA2_9TREE|nr:uncharacterized protein CcaverHIS019_0410540 [Cutaneotrichosporon cavernicola]BEI84460.1 hypothetical protein CcaverHIS002_0410640 [Cutaneotrichosporon cavernicola]BEI92234.1 hypothetical protein CcaverHIS019_0410540 [Cutaneotrichosporon cavernicola]BEJ00006.1 hypothetical protein CcaverHIS631_0410480 [Cutaneotrichosporon cavernicola]BEJ07778.1 hypothetical protein CcaverHIS641_0410470 [Cutaneotrichosporon cavernicola]